MSKVSKKLLAKNQNDFGVSCKNIENVGEVGKSVKTIFEKSLTEILAIFDIVDFWRFLSHKMAKLNAIQL